MALDIDPKIQWYIDNHLTHQEHNSGRKAFRACRRRWDWVYRDMYSPQVQAMPLEFGIAFHVAMETFYEPRTWNQDLEIRTDLALVAFRRTCDQQLRKYKKLNPDPDVTVLDSYKEHQELGLNMIKYYCGKMSPIYDRMWTPIRVEVSFEVPLKNPQTQKQLWCKCDPCWKRYLRHGDSLTAQKMGKTDFLERTLDKKCTRENCTVCTDHAVWPGLPVTYGGRLDALFQDNQGRYWIADWKTTSRLLDEDAEASFLQLDDQISGYLWALQQYGIQCAGFVYVEIKKVFPQAPERLTRTYKGRAFSTNKQAFTTPELFERTVMREDNDAWQMGLYDEYIRWLTLEGSRFTQRHQIHKNQHEIENAGITLATEIMDMIDAPRIYPQPGRFSCNWCLFKQPCLGKNMGEDYKYTLDTMFEKRTQMYWEIKQGSTE